MKTKYGFNKKIFSMLIEKGKGDRSLKQFAADSGISYLQMRKLVGCEQENPPGLKLIGKLASASTPDIALEDYLFAAGIEKPTVHTSEQLSELSPREKLYLEKYRSLAATQKKTLEDFLSFLVTYR